MVWNTVYMAASGKAYGRSDSQTGGSSVQKFSASSGKPAAEPLARVALGALLRKSPQLALHRASATGGRVLAQFRTGLVSVELIDPIPQQFGATAQTPLHALEEGAICG
jgi:hypothetical protein